MFDDPVTEGATAARWRRTVSNAVTERIAVHGHVVRGSAFLVVSVAITAVGTILFWLVAARVEPQRVIGTAAALTTIVVFLNYATSLGLPVMVSRYAVGETHVASTVFRYAIGATVVSSFVGVALFAVIAPGELQSLYRFGATSGGFVILCALLVGFSLAALVDARLIVLREWNWVVAKSVFVVLVRFPFLAVRPSTSIGIYLFIVAALPTALTGFIGALVLARTRPVHHTAHPSARRSAVHFATVNYFTQLTLQAPTLALPLIVAATVPKREYASFYIAFGITTVVFLVPATIAQVLLAEGGTRGTSLPRQVRVARALALSVSLVMVVASPFVARFVTLAYGAAYQDAADLLIPLVAGVLAWALTSIYLSEARIGEHTSGTLTIGASFACATLLPALVLTDTLGNAGVAVAWIFGNVVAMGVAIAVHRRLVSQTHALRPAGTYP